MRRLAKYLLAAIAGLLVLAAALYFGADTDFGHRLIAQRIAALSPKSGLKIHVGRIDGSIYGKATVRDLRLSDPQGVFFSAPDIALDWSPFKWFDNRLEIASLTAATAQLHRLPRLRPGDPDAPMLPAIDIDIGRFDIARLEIAEGVAGPRRTGRVRGKGTLHDRRALIDLMIDADRGDRLALLLDAAPDRDRFDIDAKLDAPAGGVFAAMLGATRPFALRIEGDGSWKTWQGDLGIAAGTDRLADLRLTAADGRYSANGTLALASLTAGKLQRLLAPLVRVDATATLANRRLKTQITARSAALRSTGDGIIDLRNSSFDDFRVVTDLLQPTALFPNMAGRDIRLSLLLDGAFKTPRYEYLLMAPQLAFDRTGFDDVRASGRGVIARSPQAIPVRLTARRVTGVGDVAGGILSNLSVDGVLRLAGRVITGDGLVLRSDKLTGRLSVFVDLATGRYDIGLAGQLDRYTIPGLGIVDVKSTLSAVPGPGGRGVRIVGRGQAWVRRFDNRFLSGLAGGLPVVETALERGPDGILHFSNLRITAPGFRMTGRGFRRLDGTFEIEGTGSQAKYGAFRLALDGAIDRPRLDILLARPNDAAGLRNVRLLLDPSGTGFGWRANGQSTLGPFTGRGDLLLPRGGTAVARIADLSVQGVRAKGELALLDAGLRGDITLAGALSGLLQLEPRAGGQQIRANVMARNADFAGPPRIRADRAQFDGIVLLDPRGVTIDGTLTGQGIERGGLRLDRLAANLNLRNGVGDIRASFAGTRGRNFDLQTVAQVSQNRIVAIGQGTIDRKPVKLGAPAVLTPEAGGWRLAPVDIAFAGGNARIGGLFGDRTTAVDGTLSRMPLAIMDLVSPTSGLSGFASGTFNWRETAGAMPSGRADLQIKQLARAGLVLTSRPIDLAIASVMTNGNAGARIVAAAGGQSLGRAQVRFSGIRSIGEITSAPMFAQLRFSGPVDTLWRMTGIETFDLSGSAAIGADVTGTMTNPVIRGSLRTANARVESASTGMVLTNVRASGNFTGAHLELGNLHADAGGGTVTGTGIVDFAAATPGIDFRLQADRAKLIARDDLAATVTGPLRIRTEGDGGVISGDVRLDRSLYQLGQSEVAASVPRLKVREINGRGTRIVTQTAPMRPWRLDVKATAPNRLVVTGMGIDSEWQADLAIGGTVYSPAITGRADLVRGGYEFAGKRFDLQRGVIRFQGESPPDPILDIVAQGDTQGVNATIRVTGTGLKPEIQFTSIPALPQDELLSRMLFGTSITNLSAPEAVQLAAAVAALRGGGSGLNPINALRNAVGLDRLRILPADVVTGQGISVAAGKYITRRTYVEIITDGQGYSATRVEFQVSRWLSLLSTISTIGRQSATVRISKDY